MIRCNNGCCTCVFSNVLDSVLIEELTLLKWMTILKAKTNNKRTKEKSFESCQSHQEEKMWEDQREKIPLLGKTTWISFAHDK